MAEIIEPILEKYRTFITNNPLLANEIEVGLKWLSYFVAGRFSRSPIVTEFIHSTAKLLTLVNDNILRRAAGIPVHMNVVVEKLQTFLTIIDYSEVFAEVAAHGVTGSKGKWLIIVSIQMLKFSLRLLLLLNYKEGLQPSPPILPLNRRREIQPSCADTEKNMTPNGVCPSAHVTFTLKTSGRVIRTLDAAPPLISRSWKLPSPEEDSNRSDSENTSKFSGKFMAAEMLHITRPLIHLASMGVFGKLSWKPWLVALGIDVTCLRLLKDKPDITKRERMEINHRALSLILYLLRSPFYDQYSKEKIENTLQKISDKIIGSGFLLRPIIEYIPEWQQLYSYTWST